MCVCGVRCVCCHPIYSGRQTKPFIARRMQPCLFLVDRKAKSNYVHPRHNRSPLVGHDVRENHTARLFFVFIFSYIYEKK